MGAAAARGRGEEEERKRGSFSLVVVEDEAVSGLILVRMAVEDEEFDKSVMSILEVINFKILISSSETISINQLVCRWVRVVHQINVLPG